MKNSYDCLIIGSGLGGLSAAAILAKKGKKVLVLEKHYQIGGFATNFKRKDFIFDVSLHQIGGVEKTTFKEILRECGVLDKIDFIKHKYLYEAIYDDFELKVKNGDVKSLKKELYKLFPKEKFGIWLWFLTMQKIGWEVNVWDKAVKNRVFMPLLLYFAPFVITILMFSHKISVKAILNFCTKDMKLQKILTQLLGYFGKDMDIAMQVPFIASYGYYFDGGYYIKGGSGNLSNRLKEVIESCGGKVEASNEVYEIYYDKNKAIGVRAKKGEYYAKDIICNASPFVVYEKLLKKWQNSNNEIAKIEKLEIGPSVSQFYIGLDCLVEKLNPRFKDSYIVFVDKDNCRFTLSFHSNIDPTFTKENRSTLCITYLDDIKRWENLSKEEYKKKKGSETDKIISKVQSLLPNIKQHIEVIELGTPKTMQRYTNNKDGAIYGFSQKLSQAGFDRFSYKSPLKNLYFASAWTFPSGGFEGAMRAGYKIAMKIS
jgi:prolycopene isomerase